MAWTAPNLWTTGQMVTAALLNTYVRDNLLTLSTHAHGGEAGDGDDELAGIDFLNLDDIGNPGTAGRLQRNGNNLLWGASNFNVTNADPSTSTAGLRTLSTGSTTAAPGNHNVASHP